MTARWLWATLLRSGTVTGMPQPPPSTSVTIQTRLRFDVPAPTQAVPDRPPRAAVPVRLDGDRVTVDVDGAHAARVWSALAAADVTAVRDADGTVTVAVADVARLATHGGGAVTWQPDAELAAVFDLLSRPPGAVPATVTRPGEDGTAALLPTSSTPSTIRPERLDVTWTSVDGTAHHAQVAVDVAVALLAAEVPIVASAAAWHDMASVSTTPVQVATARINADRIVTLTSSYPQLLEAAPVPTLFRLSDGRYGAPVAHAPLVASVPGIRWDGPTPAPVRHTAVGPSAIQLSTHALADLQQLMVRLADVGTAAIVWQSGLGRRVFALAAADQLDLWPALVVCHPAALWVWHRHLAMFGDPDATVVTYRQLAAGTVDVDHAFVVCDGLSGVTDPQLRDAVRHHIGGSESVVVATDSTWPTEVEESLRLLSLLKPGEFADMPVARRYPPDSAARAGAHERLVVLRRSLADPDTSPPSRTFAASRTITVEPSAAQQAAVAQVLSDVATNLVTPTDGALQVAQVITCGTDTSISPKVVRAAATATAAARAGRSVAVLVAFRRAGTLIAQAVGAPVRMSADVTGRAVEPTAGTVDVVRFTGSPPDVRGFDEVVVVDWPVTVGSLDDAVGPADADGSVRTVWAVHCAGSVDDRLVELACGAFAIRWPLDDPTARWLLAAATPAAA